MFDFNIFISVFAGGMAAALIAWYVIYTTEKAVGKLENLKELMKKIDDMEGRVKLLENKVVKLEMTTRALKVDFEIVEEMLEKGKRFADRKYKR